MLPPRAIGEMHDRTHLQALAGTHRPHPPSAMFGCGPCVDIQGGASSVQTSEVKSPPIANMRVAGGFPRQSPKWQLSFNQPLRS